MITCSNCGAVINEKVAAGICPHCGEEYAPDNTFLDETDVRYIDPQWLTRGTILHGCFEIIDVINAGGFGILYKAKDRRNEALKAIKEFFQQAVCNRIPGTKEVLISAIKRKDEFEYGKKRFLEEARIVAGFSKVKSIVKIDDYFEENNTAYMVMEYIGDDTLEDYIVRRRRLLSPNKAIDVGVQLCEALKKIHRAGVIHRDIAPDNIFINDDTNVRLKIIDFGSARLSKEDTSEQLIVLKPGFAPPEQYEKIDLKNDKQREWTDIYAVGATLYFALTGIKPIEASDRRAAANDGKDPLKYPTEINKKIPEFLSNTIMKAMAVNIHERFRDAETLEKALLRKRKVLPLKKERKRKRLIRFGGIAVSVATVAAIASAAVFIRASRVLPEADITIWYEESENELLASQKDAAMRSVLAEMGESEKFKNVTTNIVAYSTPEYEQVLQDAVENNTLPDIFEQPSSGKFVTESVRDIDDTYKSLAIEKYNYLGIYGDFLCQQDVIPMGFNVPVIYVNTRFVSDVSSDTKINSIDEFLSLAEGEMQYRGFGVRRELTETYSRMLHGFEEYSEQASTYSLEDFLDGEIAAYFSDTADYYAIRNNKALQLSFEMIKPESEKVLFSFCNYWSMSEKLSGDEERCAKEVILYFMSNNAQRLFYSGQNPGFPLEKDALKHYPEVQSTVFKALIDECDNYTFE